MRFGQIGKATRRAVVPGGDGGVGAAASALTILPNFIDI